jgi:molybdate-binding protein/DNA-binding XRE family transcriptional regulator
VPAEVRSRVRAVRESRGLGQAELARLAGLSRQALSAIEAGRYVPNTAVALRLAQVLGCAVEDLFAAPGSSTLEALLAEEAPNCRVRLGRVRSRLVAWPLRGSAALVPADGTVTGRTGRWARVEPLPRARPQATLFVAGCDPALRIAGALAEASGAARVHWVPAGSTRSLLALRDGLVHVAGTHLRPPGDPEGTQTLRRTLRGTPVLVVTVASWVEGLMVRPGAAVRTPEDLLRRGVRIVNRERGSGSRAVFDRWLLGAGVPTDRVRGYGHELTSHLAVAEAVAAGLADAGPGVLPVARTYGLDFVPVCEQRYDLVVPQDLVDLEPVRVFLDVVQGRAFRRELAAVGGYDAGPAGQIRSVS